MSVQLDDELAHHVPAASRRQPRADARHDARVARLVALAHSYGPLRRVDASQAAVVRRAAEHDRRVLPRWQRAGDSIHEDAPPGAYASLAAWRSREHWLQVVVPAAIAARPDELRSHEGEARWSVSADTFLAYCRTVSLYAHQSGRRCIVRPDRLAELMETSKRTVQRCQRIAERLGLYVVVVPGRMLTVAECWRAREQGSRQRGLANESALTVPSWLPHARAWSTTTPDPVEPGRSGEPVDNPAGNLWSQKTCVTPTRGREPQPRKLTVSGSLETRSAGKSEPTPSAPSTYKTRSGAPEGARNAQTSLRPATRLLSGRTGHRRAPSPSGRLFGRRASSQVLVLRLLVAGSGSTTLPRSNWRGRWSLRSPAFSAPPPGGWSRCCGSSPPDPTGSSGPLAT